MALPFWKHPDHRIPTLGLYRQLLKTCLSLSSTYTDQPGGRRRPLSRIEDKELGPPGSSDPLPKIKRSYLFTLIRDRFRVNRHNTSPRITAGLLLEAERTLENLENAKSGDKVIRKELKDLVNGRTGRLKEVVDHLHELLDFDPGKITQRSRYFRIKRAHEQVWDIRSQVSINKDSSSYYRISLKPSLFQFPPELDYYPPTQYPNQLKNQRGKFKNSGGVFLTEVTTSEGSKFPRIRGGTQPEWISMMLKDRVLRSVNRVNEWKSLEEQKRMMEIEEEFMMKLGVDDVGYVRLINERLRTLRGSRAGKKSDTNSRIEIDVMDDF
ncbi:hypothetical protein BGZ65_007192 [Modicella reniformis]|uniref:Uncharacterized protein n=1 Tax=Modicella reniformis TaxID=1440133 RepID=A0A9P6SV63_9FUNG|nr:hypothetical protein BGZ65_007192 [Modicella reniformis]